MAPATSVTFDVWTGDEAGPATDDRGRFAGASAGPDHAGRGARVSAPLVAVVCLGAALLGGAAALGVLLVAPSLHPGAAPETAPDAGQAPAGVVLSPDQLEKLVVEVGDEEWVLIRRPHQPAGEPGGDPAP